MMVGRKAATRAARAEARKRARVKVSELKWKRREALGKAAVTEAKPKIAVPELAKEKPKAAKKRKGPKAK